MFLLINQNCPVRSSFAECEVIDAEHTYLFGGRNTARRIRSNTASWLICNPIPRAMLIPGLPPSAWPSAVNSSLRRMFLWAYGAARCASRNRIGTLPNICPKVSRTRVKELCQGETPGEIARWLVGEGECGPKWIVVARSFEIGSEALLVKDNKGIIRAQ
jgi:hypothetical protein